MFNNSYDEYNKILDNIIYTKKLANYKDAQNKEEFLILRHDIEFSIEKAYIMAEIECNKGVKANYFVQLGNNSYNPLSDYNIKKLKRIYEMGHNIGLHYRQNYQKDADEEKNIKMQIECLEKILRIPINIFSTHRPKKNTNYNKYSVDGCINSYHSDYFTKTINTENVLVKYISDSGFKWNYGEPDLETLNKYKKIQLLVHPFQWGENNHTMCECFRELFKGKRAELDDTFRNEFKRYEEALNGCEAVDI